MDHIDWKILQLLQQNARLPLKKIASQVFLSPPAVTARIERMEQKGIIQGYRAIISPHLSGQQILAFIHVIVAPEQQAEFSAFVQNTPQILACYHVTGPHSMLLQSSCPNMEQMDLLVAKLQRFGSTQTQVVLSTISEYHIADAEICPAP